MFYIIMDFLFYFSWLLSHKEVINVYGCLLLVGV